MSKLLIYVVCLLLGGLGAFLVLHLGHLVGLVDWPTGRSSHDNPTPKGGAIGIFVAFIVAAIIGEISVSLWGAAAILSFVSLAGDRREISPKVRLIVQFGSAFIVLGSLMIGSEGEMLGGVFISAIPFFLFFSVFIVGTANFYNFMDGINGIAAITGIVGFGLLAFFAYGRGISVAVSLSLSLLFACLGFLPFNIPNAKVFMGDVGSVLLGFVFACMVTLLSESWLDFICLASCLFPFYADEITTMVVRLRDKESLGKPHRRHLYQLLANELQIPHWKISICYGVVQLIVGFSMLCIANQGWKVCLSLLTVYVLLFALATYVVRSKVAEVVGELT